MKRFDAFLIAVAISATVVAAGEARAGSLIQRTPAKVARLVNPYEGDERASRAGAKLYEHECAPCHGKDAEGFRKVPPLNRTDLRSASPGDLFWVLTNGSVRHGMPSFAHLPEPERWQIITYIRSLSNRRNSSAVKP
jgi:mono/diheme cytochrome c family protein